MAGNTKRIRGDAAGKPAPQYFSNLNDAYEYLEGENGASKVMAETGAIVDLETVKNLLAVLGTIEDADSLNTLIGLLKNLKGKDFATQTTIAAALTELTAIKDTDGIKKIVDALPAGTNEIGKIAADAGKIADVITLQAILVKSAPVTGMKQLTSVPTELFAGVEAKSGRYKLLIKNEDPVIRCRIGENKASLSYEGFPIEPGATIEILFDTEIPVAIYGASESVSMYVSIMEV